MKDANNHTTSASFDARGRVITVTYPDTTTARYTYDGTGKPLTIADQANKITTRSYDPVGRLQSVTDAQTPTAGVTQYVHSFWGEVIEFALDVEEALGESAKLAASLIFQLGLE